MSKPPKANATVREAVAVLKDLTDQIKMGTLTDELGHDFRLNDAFLRAVELLARIENEPAD